VDNLIVDNLTFDNFTVANRMDCRHTKTRADSFLPGKSPRKKFQMKSTKSIGYRPRGVVVRSYWLVVNWENRGRMFFRQPPVRPTCCRKHSNWFRFSQSVAFPRQTGTFDMPQLTTEATYC
jgi:hypothetical protein